MAVAFLMCAAPSAQGAGWKRVTTPDQAGGPSGRTARDGSVTLRLSGRTISAKATKGGYTPAARRLRARG